MDPILFRHLLFSWYKVYQRPLPWRSTKDPYKIWLAEIILQQTRVAQGLPYYERFIVNYPSIQALANATEQEVLRLWQGLGYYSRARNLYYCASTIVEKYNGIFPTNYKELLTLKGIGPYTAAAIAATAFKERVAAVDGNVYRVLTRIFGIESDISTIQGRKLLHQLATLLVDPAQPDQYSQAIMDFGALQCTPRLPACATCIFCKHCIAFRTHRQQSLPIKTGKITKRNRYFDYIMVQYGDMIYMKKRIKSDIWQGLYDFYLIEEEKPLKPDQLEDPLLSLLQQHNLLIITDHKYKYHLLTHQTLSVRFHRVTLPVHCVQEVVSLLHRFNLEAFSIIAVDNLPKPILIQKFLQNHPLYRCV